MSSTLQSTLPKQQDSGLNSTSLFLSLYLVLLAFFILLNSISHPDGAKSEKVVSSVNIAFEANHDEQNFIIKKSKEVPVGDKISLGGYFATLGDIAAKEVQLISMDTSQGNVMQAIFPASAFFAPKEIYILPEKDVFMEKIAKNLQNNMMVEVLLSAEGYNDASLEISRLVAFTTRLETLGVDARAIYVGLVPGSKEQLQLRFIVPSDEVR